MASPLTAQIAVAAAQLVAEEGMDYEQAKRKAARAIGRAGRSIGMPSNEAVEDEVRAHLALFQADTQPTELALLRALAMRWMLRLTPFRPHLSGAVWRGTANRHSAIHLELYCDDPKSAEIHLINLQARFDTAVLTDSAGHEYTLLSLADRCDGLPEPVTLHVKLLDLDDLRGALKPDSTGRSWRGDVAALRRLIETDAPPAAANGVPPP